MDINKQDEDLVHRVMVMIQEVSDGMTRLSQEMAEETSLHITDIWALSVLSRRREPPMTIGVLRGHLGLSPAAMTKLVDRLEKSGYVRRAPDAGDRRRIFLEFTSKADVFSEGALRKFIEKTRRSLVSYDDETLEVAEKFLSDIRDALPGEPARN